MGFIYKIETVDEYKELVKKITAEAREHHEVKEGKSELSEYAKSIQDILNESDFGCRKETVANLISAIVSKQEGTNITLEVGKSDNIHDYPLFSAIVPLTNYHSSSYKIGNAFPVTNRDRGGVACYCPSFSDEWDGLNEGNDLCSDNNWRYATDEEIDTFFEKANEEGAKTLDRFNFNK